MCTAINSHQGKAVLWLEESGSESDAIHATFVARKSFGNHPQPLLIKEGSLQIPLLVQEGIGVVGC
jgi:hypothetical protein